MLKKSSLLILGILLFAFAIRVYKVVSLPLYGDELTIVEDSYSLLKTGKDVTGAWLPLTFKMGAGRPAGYIYFSLPFVALFGPSAWGVRGLSVLSSLGIIWLIYLLGKKLFNTQVGVIGAFLVAVSPWDISLARGGFESHFALFLALAGFYLLLKIKESGWNLIWAVLLWGLTINTYPTYKLLLPLLLLAVVWYERGVKNLLPKHKAITALAIIISIGIVGITVMQTLKNGSENRFLDINVFSSQKEAVIQEVNFDRNVDNAPALIKKIFYNKPISYFKLLGASYLENFSLQYLVITGDGQPRHNMVATGLIYIVEMITVLLGLGSLFSQKEKRREFWLLLCWLLIAPLAATLTLDNHGLRTNFMLPPLMVFSALGASILFNQKNKLWVGLIILGWLIQFVPMLERLYFLTPAKYGRFWSNMAKVVSQQAFAERGNYDSIIISTQIDNSEFAYPVYNRVDPKLVQAENNSPFNLKGSYFKKYGNVYLGTITSSSLPVFIQNLPGKVKYYGPYKEGSQFGKYTTLLDSDLVPSVISYEK